MPIRAKFQLVSVTEHYWTKGKTLVFQPRYDSSIPEDARFQNATPAGEFSQLVDNPVALAEFTLGGFYYFDASPAVPAPAAVPDVQADGDPVDLSEPVADSTTTDTAATQS